VIRKGNIHKLLVVKIALKISIVCLKQYKYSVWHTWEYSV
jgi:hypothetical protein